MVIQAWIMNKARQLVAYLGQHIGAVLFIVTFLLYSLVNISFTGPVFLDDELGYLNKAAVLAGYPMDISSSYFAGYSLVLAPFFWLFDEAQTIWYSILILNAAFMAGSVVLLWRVLQKMFPNKDRRSILAAVSVAALYPSWGTMVGYAFVTPFFALIFMLALWSSLRLDYGRKASLVLPSLLFGFMCWIHPIGIAVAAAWILTLLILFRLRNISSLVVVVAIIVGLVAVYKLGLHSWLYSVMDMSKSLSDRHYNEAAADASAIASPIFVPKFILMTLGQLAAALVTTFGLAVFVWHQAGVVLKRQLKRRQLAPARSIGVKELSLFLALAMLFVAALGSLNFYLAQLTTHKFEFGHRFDFWIYGRYIEMILLPVIGIGFLQKWSRRYIVLAASFVFVTGVVLALLHVGNGATFNYINVVSFWPQYVYQGAPNFLVWMSIGALGILYLAFIKKHQLLLFLIPLFVIATYGQWQIHANRIQSADGHPSGLLKIVRDNLGDRECIGYEGVPRSRDNWKSKEDLYRFYFYEYAYNQMSAEAWLGDANCDFYLARNPAPFADDKTATIIGRESDVSIYLVAKNRAIERIKTSNAKAQEFYLNTSASGSRCILKKCFDLTAEELRDYTSAGQLIDGKLRTTGKSGFLIYGPYRFLDAGKYKLVMQADVKQSGGAAIQIISGDDPQEASYFKEFKLNDNTSGTIEVPFELLRKKIALQVRIVVSEQSDIRFSYYEIQNTDPK